MLLCHWAAHTCAVSSIDDGATAAHANAQLNHNSNINNNINNKWGHYVRFEFLCHGLGHKSWAQHSRMTYKNLMKKYTNAVKLLPAAAEVLVSVFCSHN